MLEGRKAPVVTATERLLETHDGLAVINDVFVPVLDVVGQKYEEGAFFLPAQLEAVKAGFDLRRSGAAGATSSVTALEQSVQVQYLRGREGGG